MVWALGLVRTVANQVGLACVKRTLSTLKPKCEAVSAAINSCGTHHMLRQQCDIPYASQPEFAAPFSDGKANPSAQYKKTGGIVHFNHTMQL